MNEPIASNCLEGLARLDEESFNWEISVRCSSIRANASSNESDFSRNDCFIESIFKKKPTREASNRV